MLNNIISLKNVSKFYYSKGVIASGFSKINLDFNMGEFVAITGESGSGKSTLLNVISGLDTYEEGEMLIDGQETSHYNEKDFEDYRRKHIGNIFQNFNLINSYTVYQNIELVLLLNGEKKRKVKAKVIDLIKKVDLYKFRNSKVSKLSGGQKQRVAIARALAKDTPIIIADEPTGNLDSDSATSIIKLLSEVAKDKLVIIVTHNYEQIEQYVTRKIKMQDGKIQEDKILTSPKIIEKGETVKYKNISFFNRIKLGVRNTFNIWPKFLLLFFVFLFVTLATMSEYAAFKKQEYLSSKSGYNYYFMNTDDKRVVIKKADGTAFSEEDYNKINSLDNIGSIVKNDPLIDSMITVSDNGNFWIGGYASSINSFSGTVDIGRMPESENEIVLEGYKNDYYLGQLSEELMNTTLFLSNNFTGELKTDRELKVVGIHYIEETNYMFGQTYIYISDALMNSISFEINQQYSTSKILFANKYYPSDLYNVSFKLVPNANVPLGTAYVSNDLNGYVTDGNCIKETLGIEVQNLYYSYTQQLTIDKTYYKWNIKNLLGVEDYDLNNGSVYINPDDYNALFNRGVYQSSVFVSDIESIDTTISQLNDFGYTTLAIKDTLVQQGFLEALQIFKTIITIILVVALFFIAYFVINLIMRSRNVYFSTIRMLGANKSTAKDLLIIELFVVSNLAYFIFIGAVYIIGKGIVTLNFVNNILSYLTLSDYIILYVILMLMSILISLKYAKKLFKNSAMKTIKEEV